MAKRIFFIFIDFELYIVSYGNLNVELISVINFGPNAFFSSSFFFAFAFIFCVYVLKICIEYK